MVNVTVQSWEKACRLYTSLPVFIICDRVKELLTEYSINTVSINNEMLENRLRSKFKIICNSMNVKQVRIHKFPDNFY